MVKEVKSSDNEAKPEIETDVSNNQEKSVSYIPNQNQQKRDFTVPKWLFWSLTTVVGIMALGLLGATLALLTPLWSNRTDSFNERFGIAEKEPQKTLSPNDLWRSVSQYQLSKPMNILVLGVEPVPGTVNGSPESFSGHSDTMLLVRLNPESKSMRVLSIPRDSMANIPEMGLTKLSLANANGGSVLAARVVSRTLNNVRIDRYIRISTSALRELVDQLGGVDIYVPQAMVYRDTAQHLSINLSSGWQTLNGEKAEQFVRFRDPGNGDLGRVQRQQTLMAALRDRLTNPAMLPRLPKLARTMRNYVDTNLKREEMLALLNFSLNLDEQNFQMLLLPGTLSPLSADPHSYWIDFGGQVRLMSEYFGVSITGVMPEARSLASLKIAVQNASNQPQLTEDVVNYLQSQGFANVYVVPDWPQSQRQTQIIAQQGNPSAAAELKKVLGLGNIEVAATGDLKSDLTIRVGQDWKVTNSNEVIGN